MKGSGKTLHGRLLAKKFNIFHISFKDRLQELILGKTRKRIGPEYEDDDLDETGKDHAGMLVLKVRVLLCSSFPNKRLRLLIF